MATFDSSTALKSTGPATSLARAYLPGIGSTASKVKELVSGTEFDFALQGGAARSSDSDGNCLVSATASDYATITETFDPTSDDFTIIVALKLATLDPAAWAGLFNWRVSGGEDVVGLARSDQTNDLHFEVGTTPANRTITNGLDSLTTSLMTLVLQYSFDNGGQLFVTGGSAPVTLGASGQSITTSVPNLIRLFNTINLDGAWPGSMYLFSIAGSALTDTDCQNIGDDVAGTLFASAGGGGGGIVGNVFQSNIFRSPVFGRG